jgi:DNA primase
VDVDELVDRIDLGEYVGQYCELEQRNGEYWALSPFTHEKTPSFSVGSDGKVFYDFSSGQGGGIIKFIMLYHRVDSDTAIRMAAQYAGVDPDAPEHRRSESTKALKRLSKLKPYPTSVERTCLLSDLMDRYPFDVDGLKPWLNEGIGVDSLRKFEVRYDATTQSILFPIKDEHGNILVIKARLLDQHKLDRGIPKYSCLSKWGSNDTLYGLFENRQNIIDSKEVIIFEGEKSVMKCDTWGIGNAVAALTSHLNEAQVRLLIGLGVNVVIAFDKGVDVRADTNIRKLCHFTKVSAIIDTLNILEDKMAPVDMGKDIFMGLYQNAVTLK